MNIEPKNTVQSLAKGFKVLQAFCGSEPELTLAEVARAAALDNATAFRLINTLVMLGYLERIGESRRFRLTLKCLDLGFAAIARADLRTLARPILRGLVGEINEAASIGVLEGTEVVYVERVQAGMTRLGVEIRLGSRVPVYSTAIGRAILAFLPRESQVRVLKASDRVKLTERTVTEVNVLLSRLKTIRKRGYAVSDQETVPGLFVLAAPILDLDESPVAALSVAAPAMRSSLAEFVELATVPVLQAAKHISRALQASGSFSTHVKA